MNNIGLKIQPQTISKNTIAMTFKGETEKDKKIDQVIDTAKEAFKKTTQKPDETAIKTGVAAVGTVASLWIAKQIPKLKIFIDKSSQSPNKVVKVLGAMAGIILSLLSVLGASSLFKEKVEETKQKDTTEEVKDV